MMYQCPVQYNVRTRILAPFVVHDAVLNYFRVGSMAGEVNTDSSLTSTISMTAGFVRMLTG
jgi:hypothetical protein